MKELFIDKLINHDNILSQQRIQIGGKRILSVESFSSSKDIIYPYAVPGFIDMHSHGGLEYDISDGTMEAFNNISRYHLINGTTSFLGSTITMDIGSLKDLLERIQNYISCSNEMVVGGMSAECLGIHLEGPWLSVKNGGAQNSDMIIDPDNESMKLIDAFEPLIKMVTFSYHSPSSENFLNLLINNGIIAAVGHDETIDSRILEGFSKGISQITHIYCSTSSFTRISGEKHLGSLEMALMTPGISVEVVADGKHITKYFWDFIRHNKAVADIIIVSDSTRGGGCVAGESKKMFLGNIPIIIEDGVAWLEDRSCFAGSVSNIHQMFKRLVVEWNVSPIDAVRMCCYNPALKLKISNRLGRIEAGAQADILLLDKDWNIVKIIKSGMEVIP